MNRILTLSLLVLFSCTTAFAQKNEPILIIGDNQYPEGEFWYVYNKNKHLPSFNESPEEFSERFINYKLKVVEAVSQGLDTTASFVNEYNKYIDELKASYLVDSSALKSVIDEAKDHMSKVVKASHILIQLAPNATPDDTLKAWTLITEAKNKVEKGADFNEVAVEYSQDPSVVNNKGQLGYFSAFKMIYPFEKAAFATPKGEVSDIIRTNFGYHLIFVHDKQPNPGQIRVAHIMKSFPRNVTQEQETVLKQSIDSIYGLLTEGAHFEELAKKLSDDQYSSEGGGVMEPFSYDNMVPEFAEASFALLNDNDVSEPIRTDFGWHIIKRLELFPNVDPDTRLPEIMSKLGRDGRDKAGQKAYLENCLNSPSFQLNNDVKDALDNLIHHGVTFTQELSEALQNKLNQPLFTYQEDDFTLQSLFNWLNNNAPKAQLSENQLQQLIEKYIETSVLEVEKRDLGNKNDKFLYLSNEYYDGLLIFEISNREIWSNVGKDTLALENYYNNHKEDFATAPQLNGAICKVSSKRLIKVATKAIRKGQADNLVQILIEKSRLESDYSCEEGVFDFMVDDSTNPVSATLLPITNPYYAAEGVVFWQGTITQPTPQPYEQVKGEVMTAYQNKLEEDWIKELREKYKPQFNQQMLKK